MTKGFFISPIVFLLAGMGLALAQNPDRTAPPTAQPASLSPAADKPALPHDAFNGCPRDCGPGRLWVSGEYLLWWTKGASVPSLLITGPAPAQSGFGATTAPIPTAPGFIGLQTFSSTSTSLTVNTATQSFGSDTTGVRSGARFGLGGWLDPDQTCGVEARYFFLANHSSNFSATSGAAPLAIPFTDATTGLPSSLVVGQPAVSTTSIVNVNTTPGVFVHLTTTTTTDAATGSVAIHSTSNLQGVEANAIWNRTQTGCWRLELLAGFRYVELDENFTMGSSIGQTHSDTTTIEPALGIPAPMNAPIVNNSFSLVNRLDEFDTRNSFYGGQIGGRGEFRRGRMLLGLGAKVALGDMRETVGISGATISNATSTLTPTQPFVLAGIPLVIPTGALAVTSTSTTRTTGGLFAQPSNIGHYTRDVFAVVPEGDLKVGYRLTDRWTASLGYTFFYVSSVARPGEQIDRTVNPAFLTQPPTGLASRPAFAFHSSDFWAQGIDFGLEFRY